MKITKNIMILLLLIMLYACPAIMPQALFGAEPALTGAEMVILKPHQTGPVDTLVYMKDLQNNDLNKILREDPEFIKQVRLYQNIQKEKFINGLKSNFKLSDSQLNKILANYKPDPVYVVLNEGMVKSVSFATDKPFGILDVNKDGKTSISIKAAPIVTLSADTIKELKTGDRWGYETVCHEIGHVMMYPTHGLVRYPSDFSENIIEKIKKEGHWKNKVTTPVFAMLEGWAEFNGSFFTGSPIGDYTKIDGRVKTEGEMARTEGIASKIILDICLNAEINPDKDKGYEKITNTMLKHKCRTLNSFLVDYTGDYPGDKAVVEKIVKADTGGVLKIDYNYGFKSWIADKTQDLKKTFGVVKEWLGGLFNKKMKKTAATATAAVATASSAPVEGRFLIRDSEAKENEANDKIANLLASAKNENTSTEAVELNNKRKLLYEEYKKALVENDESRAGAILEKIKKLNATGGAQ